MRKLHSFLQNLATGLYIKTISRQTYRRAAVLISASVVVAIIAFGAEGFGGSGKNVVFAAQSLAETEEVIPVAAAIDEGTEESETVTTAEIQIPLSEQVLSETKTLVGQMIVQSEQEQISSEPIISYSQADYEALLRIVEAEAGICDYKGKVLVANVVINRVLDYEFPDTIKAVVYQRKGSSYQFSPVKSGRISKVKISDETRAAVEAALHGEDYSGGALYFAARAASNKQSMAWFDRDLLFLFEHDGHEFFARRDE